MINSIDSNASNYFLTSQKESDVRWHWHWFMIVFAIDSKEEEEEEQYGLCLSAQ